MTLVKILREYLENTSEEEIKMSWVKTCSLVPITEETITAEEFLLNLKFYNMKVEAIKSLLDTLKDLDNIRFIKSNSSNYITLDTDENLISVQGLSDAQVNDLLHKLNEAIKRETSYYIENISEKIKNEVNKE